MNKKLKARIVEKFGSQFEFARVVGAHEADVSRVIRGKAILTGDKLKTWSDALGVDVAAIIMEGNNG